MPERPSFPRPFSSWRSEGEGRGHIPQEVLDEIRRRHDLLPLVEEVTKLQRSGTEFKGLCPFHEEKTPSFSVNPEKGVFHCFGCGASGDLFGFLLRTTGRDFLAIVEDLAAQAGIDLSPYRHNVTDLDAYRSSVKPPKPDSPSKPKTSADEDVPLDLLRQELDRNLARFAYRFDTGKIVDLEDSEFTELKWDSFRHMYPHTAPIWRKHEDRRRLDLGDVVFDPPKFDREAPLGHEDPSKLNLYRGLPLRPSQKASCEGILTLFDWLLSKSEPEAAEWIRCWFAWLFQNPGQRTNSALIFRSRHQGVGKSLLFGRLMRRLLGRYSFKVDNRTLTSDKPWNEWQSRRFYIVAEELSVGRQKASELKDWITGETIVIEQRGVDTREEINYASWVFLTNDPLPLPLEEEDRRFAVVETPPPFGATAENPGGDPDFYDAVVQEVDGEGAQAFLHHLLSYPIPKDFRPHRVPRTEAKSRLIIGVRDSVQAFVSELRSGLLELPYGPAWVKDFYKAYVSYCHENGYNHPVTSQSLWAKLKDLGFDRERCQKRGQRWWWYLPEDEISTPEEHLIRSEEFSQALYRLLRS